VKEQPFFFKGKGYRLFGVIHDPEGQSNARGCVFCHPFAEEKLWTHRVIVNFARILAQNGYHVLRFDYMGNGDSEGEFEESSVDTYLDDIRSAAEWLQGNRLIKNGTSLLGLRFGATLACMAADMHLKVSRLILWEPIVDGSKYMKEMLRINISTQSAVYREIRQNSEALVEQMKAGGTVNVDGYEMSWQLYEQVNRIKILEGPRNFNGKTLLVEINRLPSNNELRLKSLAGLYCEAAVVEAVEEPFWKEIRQYYYKANNLYRVTIDWMKEHER
jgi:exosortase A-associated hydrolase 2